MTIHKQTVLLHPIMDEFYGENLNQDRSSCFAVSKGLVSTAPGTTVQPQNAAEQCTSADTDGSSTSFNGTKLDKVGRELGHGLGSSSGQVNQCAVSH